MAGPFFLRDRLIPFVSSRQGVALSNDSPVIRIHACISLRGASPPPMERSRSDSVGFKGAIPSFPSLLLISP
jgi:hypothetical protein